MKRWPLLLLGALAVAAAAWVVLRPGRRVQRSERHTAAPAASADVPARAPREAPDEPPADDAQPRGWRLTVQIGGGPDQPESAKVCVVSPARRVLEAKDVAAGKSLALDVQGPVSVVAYPAGTAYATAVSENLTPPETGERTLVVAFDAGKAIAGRVVDDMGNPIENAYIDVEIEPLLPPWWLRESTAPFVSYEGLAGNPITLQARCGPEGQFGFRGLAPGRYRVEVFDSCLEGFLAPEPVEVEAGVRDLALVCTRAVELRIRFVDAHTGKPVATDVSYSGHVTGERYSRRSGSGHFGDRSATLTVKPGSRFKLSAKAEGYRERAPVIIETNRDPGPQEVSVEFEPDPDAFATLELVITDDAGNPVGPLMIGRGMSSHRYETPTGRYTLRIPAGTHEIELEPPSDQVLLYQREWYTEFQDENDPEVARVWLPKTVTVEVGRGVAITRKVKMQRAGLVWIRTKPGASVREVQVCDGDRVVEGRLYSLYDGKGRVALVAPGKYTVKAQGSDGPLAADVTVAAEEVAEVRLPPQ